MGIFIYAFTATGKTELNKKYKNVIDMESTKYKYIGKVDETSKSTPREINKEWPNNYFKALDAITSCCIILSPSVDIWLLDKFK